MKKNSDTETHEENLPSPNLFSACLIMIFFGATMALMIFFFTPKIHDAQSNTEYVFNELSQSAANNNPFCVIHDIFSKTPRQSPLKSKVSQIKLPPFKGKKGEHVFNPMIQKASRKHNLDPALIKAVIMAESSYNPRAVSPMGAVGLMQLMPQTAESLGVQNSFNPEQNIHGGTKYLRNLIDRLDGDVTLALAAYNAGLSHVLRYNGIPPFKDTERYVDKVFYYYDFYKNQDNIRPRKNIDRNINEQSIEEEA